MKNDKNKIQKRINKKHLDDEDEVEILPIGGLKKSYLEEIKEFIKQYQSWGFSFIPVKPRDKLPITNWKIYQEQKADEQKIEYWLSSNWKHEANIGIVCGKVSGNLVVLDFDNEAGWEDFLKKWSKLRSDDIFNTTPVVKTSRGYHVYLKCKQPVKKQRLEIGIDIQGEGAYVVAPPSIGSSNHKYHFINPSITTIHEINDLSEIGINTELDTERVKQPIHTIDVLEGVPEGERDNACFKLAAKYKDKGLKYEEALVLCHEFADNCTPPFPHDQSEKCCKSAYGYLDKENQSQSESLAHAKAIVTKWLKLKDTNIIDVVLATVVSNKAQGDPVWLLLVGAPSTGKSEILRGLFTCNNVHQLGGFTANTFVSGMENIKAGLLETLPDETTLVIKDFGTLLTMRHQEKSVILQQLREIYDGEYVKEYGNGKIVHWKGRMGLLGAVTTAIDAHHGIIGELGNRYILYRFKPSDDSRDEIAYLALTDAGLEKQIREEISEAFKAALEKAPSADAVQIQEDIKLKLTSLANIVSRLRSPVSRDSYHKSINWQPDIEGPSRLVKAFAKLGKGLAALRGKLIMTDSEYMLIRRVGRDTVPQSRIKVIRYLHDGQWHPAKEISYELDMPPATLTLLLEDLLQIGAVVREPEIEGNELTRTTPYKWMLNDKIAKILITTGLIKQRPTV